MTQLKERDGVRSTYFVPEDESLRCDGNFISCLGQYGNISEDVECIVHESGTETIASRTSVRIVRELPADEGTFMAHMEINPQHEDEPYPLVRFVMNNRFDTSQALALSVPFVKGVAEPIAYIYGSGILSRFNRRPIDYAARHMQEVALMEIPGSRHTRRRARVLPLGQPVTAGTKDLQIYRSSKHVGISFLRDFPIIGNDTLGEEKVLREVPGRVLITFPDPTHPYFNAPDLLFRTLQSNPGIYGTREEQAAFLARTRNVIGELGYSISIKATS